MYNRPRLYEDGTRSHLPGLLVQQQAAGDLASVADGIRNDLARPAALGQPDPALVLAELDERLPSG